MAPLPISVSSCDDWDATHVDEKLLSGVHFAGSLQTKRKNRKEKGAKSARPLPVSLLSTDSKKQTIDSPCKEQPTRKPPTPATPKTLSHAKASNKPSNKSISNPSPRTDMKHRQVASAAAEAASMPRKKLHWNNSVRVKVIHNLGYYTPQEKIDTWFSADDYSIMEDECELTSIQMDEIEFERENLIQEEKKSKYYKRTLPAGCCERGLESWTMQGEELKEQQVQLVIDTVWQAQIDAWEFLGNHPHNATETKDADDNSENEIHNECWEFIRERASVVSKTSQLRAQEFAIKDEQAVDSYLNSLRSLEQSRRRISKMLGGKHCSSRSITRSSRTLTTAKSCRTLTTVSSSDSRSFCGTNNLKSILKSPKPKRTYSDTRSMRRSQSQPQIPLKSASEDSKDNSRSSFRIRLPRIGNDSSSLCSNSLRSSVSRGNSLRSNVSSNSMSSNSSKKIRYKTKSKTKIPTSPVGSVCNSLLSSQNYSHSNHNSLTDEEDLSMRMVRSHMSLSIGSEGSSRRRRLRAYPPL
jgi:hypothetical protein